MGKDGPKIVAVRGRQILDSRGNPTVEAEVMTESSFGRGSVPSGASKGKMEALELRDGYRDRFDGKGVSKAVGNVNGIIARKVRGLLVADQRKVDQTMIRLDGTKNKSRLGANAILSVSMAVARASANERLLSLFECLNPKKSYHLPVPMMNVINGGEHAGNELSIQEFLIEPVGADSCSEAVRVGVEVYQSLKEVLVSKYGKGAINVGDEGGFAPPLSRTADALAAIRLAIEKAGYGEEEVRLGMDAAASSFFDSKDGSYLVDGKRISSERLEDYYAGLNDEFGLLTIEDPFEEESYSEFSSITKRLGTKTRVIGDDLYVTNVERMKRGISMKSTNAVLIKLNQIGTVSETEDAIDLAQDSGWVVVVSHRSGETDDPFIAHLATAFEAQFIKTGAPARGERVAKYNELLRIEEQLGSRALFSGKGLS